jgi:Spy/CpxP family protein refolding chaperone
LENKLGLTDAQKTEVKALYQANKAVVKPIITNLRAEQKKLRALIYADTVDAAAITSETTTICGIQAELNVNRATVASKFRAILTPAQLQILKTLHQNHQNTTTAQTPS